MNNDIEQTPEEVKEDINTSRQDLKEANDCVVKSVTVTTGLPYKTVHAALKKHGRKNRQGTFGKTKFRALADLGFKVIRIPREEFRHFGKTVKTIEPWLPKGRKFIIIVSGHSVGYNGEEVVDWTKGRKHQVKQIFEVVRQDEGESWNARQMKEGTLLPHDYFIDETITDIYLRDVKEIDTKTLDIDRGVRSEVIILVPPARKNRAKWIMEYIHLNAAKMEPHQLYAIELSGNYAVRMHAEQKKQGLVFCLFGKKQQ